MVVMRIAFNNSRTLIAETAGQGVDFSVAANLFFKGFFCHPERSEGSLEKSSEILCSAQNDTLLNNYFAVEILTKNYFTRGFKDFFNLRYKI